MIKDILRCPWEKGRFVERGNTVSSSRRPPSAAMRRSVGGLELAFFSRASAASVAVSGRWFAYNADNVTRLAGGRAMTHNERPFWRPPALVIGPTRNILGVFLTTQNDFERPFLEYHLLVREFHGVRMNGKYERRNYSQVKYPWSFSYYPKRFRTSFPRISSSHESSTVYEWMVCMSVVIILKQNILGVFLTTQNDFERPFHDYHLFTRVPRRKNEWWVWAS